MIKRRFYKHEHGDRDGPSDSSSSSDSELEAEATEETEEEEDDVVAEVRENNEPSSSSSGYKSEDSSANEVDLDSSGLPTNDDDVGSGNGRQSVIENHSSDQSNAEIVDIQCNTDAEKDAIPSDVPCCVLKSKSVFKCKLCPRIVCLTEDTLRTHLKSKVMSLRPLCNDLGLMKQEEQEVWRDLAFLKLSLRCYWTALAPCFSGRHARSEKLLSEGRLKLMLNSDGEIEGETHQERHASTLAAAAATQNLANSRKKNKGRQRQRKRLKKKTGEDLTLENARQSTKNPAKKRRKSNI